VIDQAVLDIEDAFEAHWRRFGLYPGATLVDADGILRIESPIAHLPYNAVIRSHISDGEAAQSVAADVDRTFRNRNVPYMWVLRPSDTPEDLASRLAQLGLDLVEIATGMDRDLSATQDEGPVAIDGIQIVEADSERALSDYEELIRTYWSVPESDRHMIRTLNRYWTGKRNPGIRLVAYAEDRPVAKLFLNLSELPERASVYGVAVVSQARGKGLATAMMRRAMRTARERGASKMVLHSSGMARQMYLKLGFTERCQLRVFATAPVFGTHHH
jgi:GNAT superfamily N-acetyltransferase